jgi:hypothetical protein
MQVIPFGWLILLILANPFLTLTPIVLAGITSSRLNDSLATSQIAAVILILRLFFLGDN